MPDDVAGRRARCECGATFRVPRLAPDSSMAIGEKRRLLTEATLNEMLMELNRRGYHGVFVQIDTHEYDVVGLTDLVDAGEPLTRGLECHLTEPLPEERRPQLYAALAAGMERLADPASAGQGDEYYEHFAFKGDQLGMPLVEFKQKHRREIPGTGQIAPFCSDRAGEFNLTELMTESWHRGAGIVHARLDLPTEIYKPTIAGANTEILLYQFLDGRLYQIFGVFGTEDFPMVADSFRLKYGNPTDQSRTGGRLAWRRMHSTIELAKGRISPRKPATLRIYLDEALVEVASRRAPSGDDI